MDLVRRGSLVLSTAPTNIPHPWKVEWARGEKFRCFLGRIYDPSVMATEEWQPKRFPEGLSQGMIVTKHTIQRKYLKKDRTAMNSKAYATSLKSGSVKVYTKAAFGRTTLATSVLIDEEKGCAEWDESVILAQSAASVYFVLHKTSDRWMISAVLEANVTASDIKLAIVKKRESASVKDWRLIQLWKSDLYFPQLATESLFQLSVTPTATAGSFKVKVGWDDIFDDNQLSDVGDWTREGPTGWMGSPYVHPKSLDWVVPTYSGVPMSQVDEDNPEITITATTYFYFQFNRLPAAYQNTGLNPDERTPEPFLWIKDEITSATIETSATSITATATIFDDPNNTKDYFRLPIGKVEITSAGSPLVYTTTVTMSTGARYFLGTRMKLGLSYFGLGTPEVWEWHNPEGEGEGYWTQEGNSTIDPDANYIQFLYVPRARYPV